MFAPLPYPSTLLCVVKLQQLQQLAVSSNCLLTLDSLLTEEDDISLLAARVVTCCIVVRVVFVCYVVAIDLITLALRLMRKIRIIAA
jgi:hypothetical protein